MEERRKLYKQCSERKAEQLKQKQRRKEGK